MSVKRKLLELIDFIADHDCELTISADGIAALYDPNGELVDVTAARLDARNLASGLAGLLEDARESVRELNDAQPLIEPPPVVQQTWFGFGETPMHWGERKTITVRPMARLLPERLVLPSSLHGYTLFQLSLAGEKLFINEQGIPAEFFSEVSTAPQILFPATAIGPDKEVTLDVQAPPAPPMAPPFTGALYGIRADAPRPAEAPKNRAPWPTR